ncbi:hypothetical protein QGN23_00900 [Chryseobacterium gotjawalense]|uniref:Uncharacterized protein n=1 Tax=Chryseobacterium gotjawalense TaxID=3042315 RepID=A0ABY8RCZ6_9FLAO|nr:hypothetical protein [Chryseobacterium sp. wdc7]WHF51851.1 hypothetical protein QGN23_00900 [Chryseobacterium sp. wdc7]
MITKAVQNLFDFIDYLYSQTDYFLSQQHLIDEVNEIRAEQNKLRPTKHFKDKAKFDSLHKDFLEKLPVVEASIIVPIREKIEFYDIADISTPIVNLNALGDLLELQRNFDEQDLLKIKKAKNQYIIYRIKTRWQGYFSFGLFFSDLDRELYEYFKFFEEDDEVDYISNKPVKVESFEEAVQLLTGKAVYQNINFSSFTNFLEHYKKEVEDFEFDNRHSEVKRIIEQQKMKLEAATFQSEIEEVLQFAEKSVKELKNNLLNVFNNENYKTKVIDSAPTFYNRVKALLEYEKLYKSALPVQQDKTEAMSESLAEPQLKDTKAKKLNSSLVEYGFNNLEKVEKLSDKSKGRIIEEISEKGLPYAVAMLDYLGFFNHLLLKYCHTKESMYKLVSGIICDKDSSRAIKGNLNTLNINSKESRERYTAHQFTETVENYYQQLE